MIIIDYHHERTLIIRTDVPVPLRGHPFRRRRAASVAPRGVPRARFNAPPHSGSESKKAVQTVPLDNGLRYLHENLFMGVSCVADSIFDVNLCHWRSVRPVATELFFF